MAPRRGAEYKRDASTGSGFHLHCGSTRSLASDITCTDFGTDCDNSSYRDDDDGSEFDSAFWVAGESSGGGLDHRPGMPIRRQSANTAALTAVEEHDHAVQDAPPCCPIRQASATGSVLAAAMDDNHNHNNNSNRPTTTSTTTRLERTPAPSRIARPPLRPNRKLSMSTVATSVHHLQQQQQDMTSSTTADHLSSDTSSTEYVPAPLDDNHVQVRLEHLQQQATIFQSMVTLQDRTYGLRTYKQCFVGSEAVDQMIHAGLATSRTAAVALGQELERYLRLFQHVCQDHVFQDKYLFYSFCNRHIPRHVDLDVSQLQEQAARFQAAVDLQDRKYALRTYPQCFVGSQAVDTLIQLGLASSRKEAVDLGLKFQQHLGLLEHVCQDHWFKDERLFYRFCDNHTTATTKDNHRNPTKSKLQKGLLRTLSNGGSKRKKKNWLASSVRTTKDAIVEEFKSTNFTTITITTMERKNQMRRRPFN